MEKSLKLYGMFMLAAIILPMTIACNSNDVEESDVFDINQAYGTWMCIQSTDTYQSTSLDGLLVGAEITINKGGTYSSTASSFGHTGTYYYKGNQITAKSSSGDTFVVTVSIKGDKMNWKGTASTGVSFRYVFQRESAK